MISYVFIAIYFIAAALNLVASKTSNRKLFCATKPALMLALCLYCVFESLPETDFIMICALAACWAGDVLLIPEGELLFFAGGTVFFAGHVLFIICFARCVDFDGLPLGILVLAAVLYFAASGFVMSRARKSAPKIMLIPMLLYLLCNSATNLFALAYLAKSPGICLAIAFTGAVLFFLSDCALFLMRYDSGRAAFYKTDFFVMLTYIAGVFMITLGLLPPG